MTIERALDALLVWLLDHQWQLALTVFIVALFILLDRLSNPKLREGADKGKFKEGAAIKAIRIARLIFVFFSLLFLAGVWGVDFASIFVFATTAITLLGVALFAQWSMLSNITAYFVLLVHPAFARGNLLRIVEGDNYVEGYISELTLFSTKLLTADKEVIMYPNNLLLGRPALINPKAPLGGMGKLPGPQAAAEPAIPADPPAAS